MSQKSIYDLLKHNEQNNADKIAYQIKENETWKNITWKEQANQCKVISKALLALGLKKNDKVNILSQTNLQWIQIDFAAVSIGCVTVGIYPTSTEKDCAYIINHSDAKIIFVENDEHYQKVSQSRSSLQQLEHIVVLNGFSPTAHDQAISWEHFLQHASESDDATFQRRVEAVTSSDIASIVYTSGTTGTPKGVMLSHENLLFASWSAVQCLYFKDQFITLLFLPLAHVFARIIVYVCLRGNIVVAIAESIEKVAENIREVRPHFFASIPRIFEKVHEKITTGVHEAGGLKETLFTWALSVGEQVSRNVQLREPIPRGLKIKNSIAQKLVFAKIQAALGGRLVYAVSGAAPLNKRIAEFFHACGVLILEGIGMTENTSFSNVNRINNFKFGTVGQPGPHIEQKIADDGEVLFRGKNVMSGYYKNKEATDETIDQDGWLFTGDIGQVDSDGFLKITDRKKDIIITAGGKNIAPQHVERAFATSQYISQIVSIGDKKKFLVALITLQPEAIEKWASEQNIAYENWDDLCQSDAVRSLVQSIIDEGNRQLASYESIKAFRILSKDFNINDGELTPTLKVRRKAIMEKYADLIDKLYA